MNSTFKKMVLLASCLVLLLFALFVVNQTAQLVLLAGTVSTALATVVLCTLLLLYAVLTLVPIIMFLRLPKTLTPPHSLDGPEFAAYVDALKKRLASNSLLQGFDLSTLEKVEGGLAILGKQADEVIQKAASTVFLSTAISQSGRLDAFFVLSAQSRMVWRIAHIYYQRPTLRDMVRLYANVAATSFVASELEDIDVNEQIQPVLSSVFGTVALSVPGLQAASSLLVTSAFTGAANAYLTLRVGIIARRYCGAIVVAEKKTLRRAASAEAAKLLGAIVKQGTSRVTKAVWEVSKEKAGTAASGAKEYAKQAGLSFLSTIGVHKSKESPDPQA
jgi:hypothetical protein